MSKVRKIGFLIVILIMTLSSFNVYADNSNDTKSLGLLNDNSRKQLFAGYDFSGVIMEDRSIWTWGANNIGQLGLRDYENRLHPIKMNSILENKDVIKIISGSQNTIALTEDGEAYIWGQEVLGNSRYNTPVKINVNFKIKDVAWLMHGGDGGPPLSNNHSSYAIVSDEGKVYVLGTTFQGQSGRGLFGYGSNETCIRNYHMVTSNMKTVLTNAILKDCTDGSGHKTSSGIDLENIKLVQGVYYKGYMAITENNEIYTWGNGLGSYVAHKNINSEVIEGNIVKTAATGSEMFALTDRNEVWKWTGKDGIPVKKNVVNVKDIQAYGNSMMLLTYDGDVYAKGDNTSKKLGNFGPNLENITLVNKDIKEIALGHRHSLFEDKHRKIFGQGWNGYRQLANEDDGVKETFVKVENLGNATNVSAEARSTYAIKDKNQLYAWGDLTGGDFGQAINYPKYIKTFESEVKRIDSNKTVVTKATGVMLNNDKAYTWGHGNIWSLGHSSSGYLIRELKNVPNNAAYTPNTVNGVTYVVKDKLGEELDDITIKDFVLGQYGGAAVNKKGELLTWGQSANGLWGIGESHLLDAGAQGLIGKYSLAFIKAKSDEKFTKVDGRYNSRIALQNQGYVYSWGANSNMSLGRDGSILLPQRISGLSNIVDINMGSDTGMALDNKGDLYTWGRNTEGQIGNGTVGSGRGVANISGLSGIKFDKIFSGTTSMFATTEDGDLYAWGDNRYGQLGLGGRFNRTGPRKVEGLPGRVVQVDNGEEHTVVLLENGDVYTAGADTFGQLGLKAEPSEISFQEIPFPDYVTLQTKDNLEKTAGENINIDGYVTSVIPGNLLEISYEIESSNGIIEGGKIVDMLSSTSGQHFSKSITLNDSYPIGGYTVNITVLNKSNGLKNTETISFGVVDNTPPSSPIIISNNAEWTKNDVQVNITEGIDRESGVDYTEYKINKGEWERYRGLFTIKSEGENEIEARTADKAGNISGSVRSVIKIDKTAPSVNIIASVKDDTHENVVLKVDASDNLSGVKNITYLEGNKDITSLRSLEVTANDRYTFIVEDYAGNTSKKFFDVNNIVRELSIEAPAIESNVDVVIQENMNIDIPIGNMNITDWRDKSNNWKVLLEATQLTNNSTDLPKGTLRFSGVEEVLKLSGNKSGSISTLKNNMSIDDGPIEILKAFNERGEYEVKFKESALEINLLSSLVRRGSYSTKLTWTLQSSPEIY